MPSEEEYKALLSDLIKKQMVMLGPNLVLSKARQVAGLEVSDEGMVEAISGNPKATLEKLANIFMELSGNIARMTLNALLEKYPSIKNSDS